MTRATYTATGRVRGSCGHAHRTPDAAAACADRDRRECRALPGGNSYSDRHVARTDGEPLTDTEHDAIECAGCSEDFPSAKTSVVADGETRCCADCAAWWDAC